MAPIIRTVNLNKIYHTEGSDFHVLRDINISVEKGEFTAIMGASGSGKSTLMNLIGCLDTPTGGEYYLDDTLVSSMSSDELAYVRNKKVGFIFQAFNLLPRLNILENVEMPMIYADIPSSKRREIAMSKLESLGMLDYLYRQPNAVSGGQKQRAAIARALVNDPDIILADEPTGNLDSRTSEDVMKVLAALNNEGHTVIVVTHDPNIAAQTSRIIRLRDGEVIGDERK